MHTIKPPLRLGVIGLGPLWRSRWRRAVLASRNCFIIHAVCDVVHAVAAREARRFGCEVSEGPSHLLQDSGLDAVLLVDAAWHGLWPIEQAVRFQKPLLSVPGLDADCERADRLIPVLKEPAAQVQFALPWRHSPATIRLRRLLRSRLGAIKLILCQQHLTGGQGQVDAIDWCLHLMQNEPTRIQSVHSDSVKTLLLDFPGATAQITLVAGSDRPRLRAVIQADQGEVRIRHPHRLSWRSHQTTNHMVLASERSVEERVLRRFHRTLVSGQPNHSSIAAVLAAHRLL